MVKRKKKKRESNDLHYCSESDLSHPWKKPVFTRDVLYPSLHLENESALYVKYKTQHSQSIR